MAAKKACELCGNPARMLCESDQASLCWDCDEKVHAANFLVAKHSRTLLCQLCGSPTPWKAAGPKLGPTVSVCRACAGDGENIGGNASSREEEIEGGLDSAESESDGGEYDDSDSEDYSEEEEEDGENQVVPWSAAGCNSPTASPSRSLENASFSSSKRTLENPFESEDEDGCCSSQDFESKNSAFGEFREIECRADQTLLRPLKARRLSHDSREEEVGMAQGSLGTAAIVEKLQRFQQAGIVTEGRDASAMVLTLCKLARH